MRAQQAKMAMMDAREAIKRNDRVAFDEACGRTYEFQIKKWVRESSLEDSSKPKNILISEKFVQKTWTEEYHYLTTDELVTLENEWTNRRVLSWLKEIEPDHSDPTKGSTVDTNRARHTPPSVSVLPPHARPDFFRNSPTQTRQPRRTAQSTLASRFLPPHAQPRAGRIQTKKGHEAEKTVLSVSL